MFEKIQNGFIEDKKRIVIVGGGFGGVKAALELSEYIQFDVTLISDKKHFQYHPTLFHSATGGSHLESSIPLEEIFADKNLKVINDKAVRLDRKSRKIVTKSGKSYSFDIAIFALGVVTNYFGINGLEKYSFGIKSPEEAAELKAHLHKQLAEDKKPDANYIVIGGGPTGVELAGALPSYIKHIMVNHGVRHKAVHVDLVEAAPRLLPRMPKDMSRAIARQLRHLGIKLYLGKKVEGADADSLMVDGKPIKSTTIIWTAGVTNHPFFKDNKFVLSKNGRVMVDQYLQAEPNIYVIGDNADTKFSGMAQTALRDAAYVTENIKLSAAHQKPKEYKAKKPVYVVPAGPKWAAVLWGNLRIYGRLGWWFRRAADFIGYHDLEPWWPASQHWMSESISEEDCPYCVKASIN